VIKLLQEARPGEFLALVHRIDRETSGLLLIAKHADSERRFKRMLEERSDFEKTYLAITWGAPPTGVIDAPLELDPHNALRVKMRVVSVGSGLDARTSVTLLERRAGYALARCLLHTGRQHQIRIHLPRHALHAHRYRFEHAVTKQALELESPLPSDLAAFWSSKAPAR
jgi:23S rRNA pseudouridine1911/1915/1917 synthase